MLCDAQQLVWNTKIENAMEISKNTKKPIMLFFTGSDWCGWCIRLQNEVFKKQAFITWATQNVVLVEVDFPRKNYLPEEIKTQNNQLQQFFGVTGYPTVWFVNASKVNNQISFDKLGSTGYLAGGPTNWIANANEILKK